MSEKPIEQFRLWRRAREHGNWSGRESWDALGTLERVESYDEKFQKNSGIIRSVMAGIIG